MELVSRNSWGSRRNRYQRLDDETNTSGRRNTKLAKFGSSGGGAKRSWKVKISKKLRLRFVSPLKLWRKIKNGYMDMMLGLAGNVGHLNGSNNAFGGKRVPKARQLQVPYSNSEFENRLIFEIYKSMIASRELAMNAAK